MSGAREMTEMEQAQAYYDALPKVESGTELLCGCCGSYFVTDVNYRNHDQDSGYGICNGCDDDEQTRATVEMDKAIEVVAGGLNEANAAKFRALDRAVQEHFVGVALDDGVLSFDIVRTS